MVVVVFVLVAYGIAVVLYGSSVGCSSSKVVYSFSVQIFLLLNNFSVKRVVV